MRLVVLEVSVMLCLVTTLVGIMRLLQISVTDTARYHVGLAREPGVR